MRILTREERAADVAITRVLLAMRLKDDERKREERAREMQERKRQRLLNTLPLPVQAPPAPTAHVPSWHEQYHHPEHAEDSRFHVKGIA